MPVAEGGYQSHQTTSKENQKGSEVDTREKRTCLQGGSLLVVREHSNSKKGEPKKYKLEKFVKAAIEQKTREWARVDLRK